MDLCPITLTLFLSSATAFTYNIRKQQNKSISSAVTKELPEFGGSIKGKENHKMCKKGMTNNEFSSSSGNRRTASGSGMLSLLNKKKKRSSTNKKRQYRTVSPLLQPSQVSETKVSSSPRKSYNENIIFRSVVSDLLVDHLNDDDNPLLLEEDKDDIDDLGHSTALPWKIKKHQRSCRRRRRSRREGRNCEDDEIMSSSSSSTDSLSTKTIGRQDYFEKLSDEMLIFDEIEEQEGVEEDIFSMRHYPSRNNAIPLKQYQRRRSKCEAEDETNMTTTTSTNNNDVIRNDYNTSLSTSFEERKSAEKQQKNELVQEEEKSSSSSPPPVIPKCTEELTKKKLMMWDKINSHPKQLLQKQGSFKFAKDINVLVKQESFSKLEKDLNYNLVVRPESPLANTARQPRRRSLASSAA